MSEMDWKTALKSGPTESQSKVRYDLSSIPISVIAKQFYCEKQIDFERTIGKVTSDEEILGTDIHDDLIDSKSKTVDIDEMIESIENEDEYLCIFPMWFQLNGLTVVGRPDLVVFQNSNLYS